MTIVTGILAFALVAITTTILLALSYLRRKSVPTFREIRAFTRMQQAIGRVVEDGSRLHVSLGRAALSTPQSASALAGLTLLRRLAELTSAGDKPPVATSGDASLSILSQDTLQSASRAAGQPYDPTAGRLTGLTPFSYAAGVIPVIRDENVSTNVLIGNFGMEAGLLTDASERENAFTLAASDSLPAQAILYAGGHDPLIGEELFAAGAYIKTGPLHIAGLIVQDILRWLIIILILIGAFLKVFGLI